MARRPASLGGHANTETARKCEDCQSWPAPVQWDKHTRLCEECAKTRRTSSEGVASVTR